jgi:hypothetical protein
MYLCYRCTSPLFMTHELTSLDGDIESKYSLMFNLDTLLSVLFGIICRDQYILATVWTDIYSLYIECWLWFILIWSWIYSNGSQIKVFISASFTPISPWHIAIVLLFTVQYYTITALERDQYEVLWSRVQQYWTRRMPNSILLYSAP